jgi:hypothetical protein
MYMNHLTSNKKIFAFAYLKCLYLFTNNKIFNRTERRKMRRIVYAVYTLRLGKADRSFSMTNTKCTLIVVGM